MGKRKTLETIAGQTSTTTTRTRTAKVLTADQQALISTAETQVKEARAKVKEAKALGKLIGLLTSLSAWGIEQLMAAVEKRKTKLNPPDTGAAPVEPKF